MVWYCDKCKSYHEDGQWCPNMGILDPVIDFFGGVAKGYMESQNDAEERHNEWQRQFDADNRAFREKMYYAAMADAEAQQRRHEAEYAAQLMREQAARQEEILRLKIALEREKQKRQNYYNTQNSTWTNSQLDDPFEVLGVPRNASRAQVIDAFRQQTQRWHPDKFQKYADERVQEMAHERFLKIKKAYEDILRIKGWK